MNDSSFGNNESVLLSLFSQIVNHFSNLTEVFFIVRIGHVNNESRAFIFITINELEFFNVADFGVFKGLSIFRIDTG